MQRRAIVALVLAAGGTSEDERPRNLDYITEAILAPSCGSAQCHSSFKRAGKKEKEGYAFDTIDAARAAFQNDRELFEGDDKPGLIYNLTQEQNQAPRMPYDAPLPDVDIALIEEWMRAGAPGVCNTGATGCLDGYAVHCITTTEKGAYDLRDMTATNDCTLKGMRCVSGACE
ncbi:hypothetical protein BH11MYX3_BH11MYX3_34470 [soil metagenome]